MIEWKRPSGSIIKTGEGESIIKFAKAWGWVRADSKEPEDKISGMMSKDEVEAYILSETGIDIDKRGSLKTVKEKARALINGNGE
jgi:hypothetical protein